MAVRSATVPLGYFRISECLPRLMLAFDTRAFNATNRFNPPVEDLLPILFREEFAAALKAQRQSFVGEPDEAQIARNNAYSSRVGTIKERILQTLWATFRGGQLRAYARRRSDDPLEVLPWQLFDRPSVDHQMLLGGVVPAHMEPEIWSDEPMHDKPTQRLRPIFAAEEEWITWCASFEATTANDGSAVVEAIRAFSAQGNQAGLNRKTRNRWLRAWLEERGLPVPASDDALNKAVDRAKRTIAGR